MTTPYVIPNESATNAYVLPRDDLGRSLAQLGAGLGQIGVGIADIRNPHREFQKKLRELIASNPDALSKIADFAHENPTAFQAINKMFPRDILGAVQETRPSVEAIARRRIGTHVEQLKDMPTSEAARTDMTAGQLEAWRALTGTDPGGSARSAQTGEQAAGVHDYYRSLSPEDKTAVDRYEIDWFRHQQDVADQERLRLSLARERNVDRVNDYRERYHAMTVEMMIRKYGVGTAEMWDLYLTDPRVQQRARDLAHGKAVPLNDNDKELMQMGMRISSAPDREAATQRTGLMRQIATIQSRITGTNTRPPDDEETVTALDIPLMQQALDQLATPIHGGPRLKVEYRAPTKVGPITVRGRRVQLVDELGQEVDPSLIAQLPTDPSSADPNAVAAMLQNNQVASQAWAHAVQSGNIMADLQELRRAEVRAKVPMQNGAWWTIMQVLSRVSPNMSTSDMIE